MQVEHQPKVAEMKPVTGPNNLRPSLINEGRKKMAVQEVRISPEGLACFWKDVSRVWVEVFQ
jgi:hypothetical protein